MIYWIIFIVIFLLGCGLVCYAVSSAASEGEELGRLLAGKQTDGKKEEI